MDNIHFSSKSVEWSTPQNFFDELNREFNFTLDVCADETNKKCEKYFDKETNALCQEWGENICFMNPPYGRNVTGLFVRKAYVASKAGATVVCLLPSRTDTKWFHDYCLKYGQIRFIKGRLKFGGGKDAAPFPSVVVIFSPTDKGA